LPWLRRHHAVIASGNLGQLYCVQEQEQRRGALALANPIQPQQDVTLLWWIGWNVVRKEVVKVLEHESYTDTSYEGANPGPLFV